jgi:hypothetical protein
MRCQQIIFYANALVKSASVIVAVGDPTETHPSLSAEREEYYAATMANS